MCWPELASHEITPCRRGAGKTSLRRLERVRRCQRDTGSQASAEGSPFGPPFERPLGQGPLGRFEAFFGVFFRRSAMRREVNLDRGW
jgi:hypothetical protein